MTLAIGVIVFLSVLAAFFAGIEVGASRQARRNRNARQFAEHIRSYRDHPTSENWRLERTGGNE